jgi:DNA-binding transcriptional ArsR family regulator
VEGEVRGIPALASRGRYIGVRHRLRTRQRSGGRSVFVRGADQYLRMWWWVLVGSRGGATRARILKLLMEKPMNKHQIAKALGLSYTTIEHHIKVLEDSELVEKLPGARYGAPYYLSRTARERIDEVKGLIEEALSGDMEKG